jgi:hypothetical protein
MKNPTRPAKNISELFPEIQTLQPTKNIRCIAKFSGTDNARHLRVLRALLRNPAGLKRERVDRIAGCSNSPELVAELRRRGLGVDLHITDLPCYRIPELDRDNETVWPGVYRLTACVRKAVLAWFAAEKKSINEREGFE